MKETAFETPDPAHLNGKMSVEVLDPSDPGTPTNIIETDDAWKIKVDWELNGLGAPYVGGTWHVHAYLDDADGVAPSSGLLASANKPVGPFSPPLPRKYSTTLNIPAHRVGAGIYQLVVALNYDNGAKLSMAAFVESGILQFYDKQDA
ncbi:MAG TPA: hypothetical protein VF486_06525 [Actinomycetes bacterium]